METDKVSVLNKVPCKECFNFMTVEVNTGNLHYLKFGNNKILQKHLQRDKHGETTIWYCKKSKLPNTIYVTKNYSYHIVNVNCNCVDTENV